ncbi:transcription elongation factor SPT6 [Danio rerio]|uniref:Transcription elongation factor SPT6 n=1 Tax=Danio rerio TaxID=7955 RepID=SPT6H_DANRE|nr:transcription elongation factor SPT6 [Danio rerio]Q8UVK2.1 RecName: Full=Transcription elongation factor SPT6; AltName: Full=Protein pandora [Danio rerio]AAL73392.1 Spt6 [Danio rerio]|eukprot:NP_660094.1 transcription elongation factor SPT6 [Danio rerio]
MSDFIESEAEESEEEFEEKDLKPKKTQRFMEEDEEEEEENTEDQDEHGNLRGLIDDDDVEEEEEEERGEPPAGEDSDSGEEVRHRRRKRSFDDYLDDDDLDLIEENLGVKVKRRKKKYSRVKTMDDEGDDDDEKDLIADEIFTGDGDGEGEVEDGEAVDTLHPRDDEEEEDDEESDIDDFIVDDDGQPITKKKGKKFSGYTDAALQEAQEIFGGDFDFAEFDTEAYDHAEEEEEDQDDESWDRPKKQTKRRVSRRSIFEIYEPSELESSHMTDQDNEIRSTDMPERFQLRAIPVKPAEDDELEEEAEWIYRNAFSTPTISMQESTDYLDRGTTTNFSRKGPSTIAKIKEALNFMRNQHFEVPFIAFYRKEYVEPELNINDLWKVWQWDEKWTQLKTRKQNLTRLFQRMQSYQFEQISADPDKPLADSTRPLDTADMERLKDVQSIDELGDVYNHFLLYYGRDIPKMQNAAKGGKKKLKKIKEVSEEDGEEAEVEEEEEEEEQKGPDLKQASRRDMYSICQSAGLDGLAKKFGLTPEQFGENLRDSYQRHETEQFPAEPLELAKDYVCSQFNTPEAVLEGARYMVAMQIAREPLVRHVLRQTFQERAKINIKPTKKGKKDVDEAHFAYSFKYLKNKPVKELSGDQFLKMCLAEEEGLLAIDICIDLVGVKGYGDQTYFDEIKQFYYRDEFSHQVQEWNKQRTLAIERSLQQFLYPQMAKELKNKLIAEAKDNIVKSCCKKLYNWLKVAPYRPDQQVEEDDDLMDESQGKGIRVLGVAFASGRDTPVFCSLINGEGEVVDFLRLPYFLKRRNAWREDEREKKQQDVENLKKFLLSKKPHVVAVSGENRDAHMVMEDIKRTISELEQNSSLPVVGVELVDNELAVLYMNSKKSEADFRDYPPLLRQAVSVARKIQDPLVEFAQVCSTDDDILCLKLHPLQEHVVKEELLSALYCEFINRVNEVGVDVNRAIAHPYTQSLVQYICGLGPRKGSHLLKILKQNNTRLENRTQLVTMCHMGPKVFINCAGFIKIDTASLGDSTDSYIEVLDGSRVHPETYEWARKMAVDALEYDESAEDANPAGALEEILENPERLKDLDLDAFAEELERQGYGNKGITLYDIRAELSCRYKDLRAPYRPPNTEEVFNMLTKETPETFYIGKLITCVVTNIAHRRPQGESYDQAIRNDETGLWQCPFCQQDNFPELSEVWNHFDSGSCPGQAIGVRTRLDNAVMGFIPTKFLSDKVVKHPEERVKPGMTVHCRIMKIDIEKFNVDLTCRTSDLSDKNNEWKLPKDTYYDFDAETDDVKQEEEQKKKQQRTTYIKRVIAHPSFHNINFKQAEKMMESMDQGDVVIRPSSKGENHLTVTWKVADGIYQHVDVREEGKENAFSLGHTLWINTEEFEDLDEITARYVQPMAAFARDLLGHKYFHECNGGDRKKMEELLVRTKKEKPTFIPYYISACRDLPGKFLLGYQPRGKPRIEYVTITPDGFRYRSQIFPTVNGLFRWFKDHYQDPVPGVTPASSRTRTPASVNATPANINIADLTRAVNSLPRNMTSQMFNAIAAVTGQGQNPNTTPAQWASSQYGYSGGSSAGGGGGSSSAYHVFATPQQPMATPLMTPSYSYTTPGQQQAMTTPQYPSSTPQSSHGHHQHSSSTPSSSSSRVRTPQPKASSHTAVDWGKMAEQWLQEKEAERRKQKTPRMTPRPSPSPMIESTPMSIAGDATPLLDEMDR